MTLARSHRAAMRPTLLLAGLCAGCGGLAANPPALTQPAGLSFGRMATGANVYAVDSRTQAVTVYSATGKTDQSPLAVIGGPDTDLIQPDGIAVDGAGRIYVANAYYPGSVVVFGAAQTGRTHAPPAAVISGGSTGIDAPTGVAVDAAGRIYVADNAGYFSSVTVYAPNPHGNVTGPPLATITGSNTNIHYPLALALGPRGEICVLNGYGQGYVTVYAPHPHGTLNEQPRATIGGGSTELNGPDGLAVGADGKVYVANATPTKGYLGSVTVYPPPHGNFSGSPIAVIGGVRSGVQFPAGLALDPAGDIYVTNQYANSITAYAPNPIGSITGPPIGAIHGRATDLVRPVGVAIH